MSNKFNTMLAKIVEIFYVNNLNPMVVLIKSCRDFTPIFSEFFSLLLLWYIHYIAIFAPCINLSCFTFQSIS